jgi:hypothetical protein
MQKRLVQVDAFTGEIEDGFVAYMAPKRRNGFVNGWVAMSQQKALIELARADLGDEARRVLFVLLGHVEYENFIVVPQAAMAKEIGMAKSHFSRAVTRLVDEGVIERGPKVGRMVSLRLNPSYGWKGTAKNHVIALDQERNRRRLQLIQVGHQEQNENLDTFTGDLFPDLNSSFAGHESET